MRLFKAGLKGLNSEVLVLISSLGDAPQSPLLYFHVHKAIRFIQLM